MQSSFAGCHSIFSRVNFPKSFNFAALMESLVLSSASFSTLAASSLVPALTNRDAIDVVRGLYNNDARSNSTWKQFTVGI